MTNPSPTRRPLAQLPPRIPIALLALAAILAALLVGASAVAQAARDDLALVSRQSGAAGAAGNGHSAAGVDLGRRALRRLLLGRGQPHRGGRSTGPSTSSRAICSAPRMGPTAPPPRRLR